MMVSSRPAAGSEVHGAARTQSPAYLYHYHQPAQGWRDQPACSPLSLRALSTELLIILAYLVITRIGTIQAAKWGIEVGPVPIFLTDMALALLLVLNAFRRPGRLLFWCSCGTGAGPIGFAVWMLCIADIIYFIVSFPTYHLYAIRDLAIFGYSLLFTLTYFSLDRYNLAVTLTRYFVYAGGVAAALLVFTAITGVGKGLFGSAEHIYLGRTVETIGNGDLAGVFAFSFAALLSYITIESANRKLHLTLAVACILAVAIVTNRSATVGLLLAAVCTFFASRGRVRRRLIIALSFMVVAVVLGSLISSTHHFKDWYLGVRSAAGGSVVDPTAAFRIQRWNYALQLWLSNPLFGVGFGHVILPYKMDWNNFNAGMFNAGMPHNTFLFVLDRMGIVGLGLIVFCWILGTLQAFQAFRRSHLPDVLAAANILIAMAGFAAFVLFFERPMNNASFWIMLAVAQRLAETSWVTVTSARITQNPFITPRAPQSMRQERKIVASKGVEGQTEDFG
jgi:O-antigen ligase